MGHNETLVGLHETFHCAPNASVSRNPIRAILISFTPYDEREEVEKPKSGKILRDTCTMKCYKSRLNKIITLTF